MLRIVFLMSLAAALVLAQPAPAPVKQISADELKTMLEKKDGVVFLDVREPKELQEDGTIEGYVHIPLGQLERRLAELPKNKPIVTICRRGVRAGKAAEILSKNGYKPVAACGLTEWKEKKYALIYPKMEEKR
ncbi:MAG: rhodanese-like domain-containing protein [Bryobacterales bacterium]|nr:rhodanese-like domain-containing protein [Bryobacterales bacterium]